MSREDTQRQLDELYALRDDSFHLDRGHKSELIATLTASLGARIAALPSADADSAGGAADRAFRHYCRGKLANAADAFDAHAAADLASAVKLDPSNIDAWNCLGECMWKSADLKTAKHCFESALEFSEVCSCCLA
jgi:hypothetical protein